MITRIWHGQTSAKNADQYLEFLLTEGTHEYRHTDGNLSARIWKSMQQDRCDFWTVSEWNDLDAVRRFAGADYDKAKYYPFDDNMLLEFEEHVRHYESFDVSTTRVRNYILQLEQLYNGGNWVGESFAGKMNHLKDEIVFTQPMPGVHSVAELIWHCIYWRQVTLRRLHGEGNKYRDETAEQYNFVPLEDLKIKGWDVLKRELSETQTALVDLLKTKTDAFLANEYQPGYSYDFLIAGTIQHDYYHLGQIGLVVKMVSMKN